MLYLFVSPTGRKTWKVLYTLYSKKDTITLGEYPKVLNAKDARVAVLNKFTELGRPHTQVVT